MSELRMLLTDLAASIWVKPGTFEELYARKIESLKNADEYMFFKLLAIIKRKEWVYVRGEVYYCYKKTVKEVLNPSGYELELPSKTSSEFEDAYKKWLKQFK